MNALEVRVHAWSDEEKKVLTNDGAIIYPATGLTIRAQKLDGQPFWYVVKAFQIEDKDRLLDYPSRLTEVAIYPNPERFFVEGSFKEGMPTQQEMLAGDLVKLRKKFGIDNLDETLPEAAEATEIVFRHYHATGRRVKLLGKDYKYRWMRTATPTTKTADSYMGVYIAHVGDWAELGLVVDKWHANGVEPVLGAARWLVPATERVVTIGERTSLTFGHNGLA